MSKRMTAILFASFMVAACNNGTPAATSKPTTAATTAPIGTSAPASQAGGDVDPNTVAAFCLAMKDTLVANWPPKDAAAAALLSPLLRNWSNVAVFAAVATDLLAVSDWTASMSIMSTVPAPPSDVAAAWDKVVAFQTSSCAG